MSQGVKEDGTMQRTKPVKRFGGGQTGCRLPDPRNGGISQEDRELLNSLETYQLYKNSPFNKRNPPEPSNWEKLWFAALSGTMLMTVVPLVFGIFIIAISFALHYFFSLVSWVFGSFVSFFRILF
jgi:hypothetical protein